MIPILALLRESWLTLRAERLFKVVLALNILVVFAYASLGFDKTGFFIFYGAWHYENEFIYSGSPLATTLYLSIYSAFIVNIWLGWIAAILALISTSSIFPTFLSQGAVELVLSRPPRRSTVFLTKYAGGLLWVGLQVCVFTIGAFLASGWRIGLWDPAIFLAIPLITLFYSFLFCINVLVGVITRSTLVALLATMVFWSATFAIRQADDLIASRQFANQFQIAQIETRIGELLQTRAKIEFDGSSRALDDIDDQLARQHDRIDDALETSELLDPWAVWISRVRAIVPETARTIGLLQRSLERHTDISFTDLMTGKAFEEDDEQAIAEEMAYGEDDEDTRRWQERAQRRRASMEATMEREQAVPAWWIITKSLIFECVVLCGAILIFRRRDF